MATKVFSMNVSVDGQLKAAAEEVLARSGLTMEEAIGLFFREIVARKDVPFSFTERVGDNDDDVLLPVAMRQRVLDSLYDN